MRLTKRGVVWGLLVLWPAILWILAFGIATIARMSGCDISAMGPSPCIVLGVDVGEDIYPLWALGLFAGFVLIWVIVTGIIWWIAEIIRSRS
jgi:hypothetical protein